MTKCPVPMPPHCPKCQNALLPTDINPVSQLVFCRHCEEFFPFTAPDEGTRSLGDGCVEHSKLLGQDQSKRMWQRQEGPVFIVGAKWNSTAIVTLTFTLVSVAFSLFLLNRMWHSISAALAALLRDLSVDLPAWLAEESLNRPTPGIPIAVLFGVILPVCLAAFPFYQAVRDLKRIFGRTELRISPTEGLILQGWGCLSQKQRFEPSRVRAVHVQAGTAAGSPSTPVTRLVIETQSGQFIKIGQGLAPDQLEFMEAALQPLLVK